MLLEDDIRETAIRICDQTASAVEKYNRNSGEDIYDMPEYFIGSHAYFGLSDVFTITLETNSRKLWNYHADIRRKWSSGLIDVGNPPSNYNPTVGSRRADLVLYKGDHSNPGETEFWAVVEFKKGYLGFGDLKKITDWFMFIDTCPYGLICAFTDAAATEYLIELQNDAIKQGDGWVEGRIARPLRDERNFQTFARILTNPHYRK
jgi:hypothetical protein